MMTQTLHETHKFSKTDRLHETHRLYESQRPMTAQFKDALGNQFDVMYDAATGYVLQLQFDEYHGSFSTIVTKENGTTMWTASRVERTFSAPTQREPLAGTESQAQLSLALPSAGPKNRTLELIRPQQPIPVFTRVLADARFDARLNELTLASSRFSKRWVFRANGKADFFSAEGHRSFA